MTATTVHIAESPYACRIWRPANGVSAHAAWDALP
jgi:hypothetical protein